MNEDPQVLILEDDAELGAVLARGLDEEGFSPVLAFTGADALAKVAHHEPDVLIIDVGLPDSDGRDVCQALRARGMAAPVLFLTARDSLPDVLSGFSSGGDDYMTKPFAVEELLARLRALVRRGGQDREVPMEIGPFSLDPTTYEIHCGGVRRGVTPTEFRLLATLASRFDSVVPRADLIDAAWPSGAIVHENTLDVYLARLRRKLRDVPEAPRIVTTQRVGYRLTWPESD
ncbi:MAG: response regulator transcription factor [Actinobacteria bacterium]|nr:response regulator transcription factor [Actinomycetota bacterium]